MSQALTLSMQLAVPGQSIDSYARVVRMIPMLAVEEERKLALQLHVDNDLEAARALVMSHLRFVMYIANGYRGYGLPQADLIQEGNIGLMKAVKRFDPHVGVRLVSFAVHWIRAEIHEYILRNWRIVKVATTKSQRKLFFNLRNAKKHLGWLTQEEVEIIAKDLGVSPKEVVEMEKRLNAHDTTFESLHDSDGDDDNESLAPEHYLEDHRYDPARIVEQKEWQEHGHIRLREAIEKLDARSQDILQKRWLSEDEDKVTLQKLAEEYQISAERIRQIENHAVERLKKNIVKSF